MIRGNLKEFDDTNKHRVIGWWEKVLYHRHNAKVLQYQIDYLLTLDVVYIQYIGDTHANIGRVLEKLWAAQNNEIETMGWYRKQIADFKEMRKRLIKTKIL